jgi:hypothetical protein
LRNGISPSDRLTLLNGYLPLALSLSDVLDRYPIIQISDRRLKWTQSPIVALKYRNRIFNGSLWDLEILHCVFLKGILLLDVAVTAATPEVAVGSLREAAGVFQYLVSDATRDFPVTQPPVEFQPVVLNALVSLALAEAWSVIVTRGEDDPTKLVALGNVCFTGFSALSAAVGAIQRVPRGVIHPQFVNWLAAETLVLHAGAALFLCFSAKQKGEMGEALGLVRVAIDDLQKSIALDSNNKKINESAAGLLSRAEAANVKWGNDNFRLHQQAVLEKESAQNKLASTGRLIGNSLPQAIPFVLPTVA